MIPPERLGMLRRSRCVQIFLETLTMFNYCSTTCPCKSSSPSAHLRHPMKRKKKRPHDYVHKTSSQNSPADMMRSAYKRTKKISSVKSPHPNLARFIAVRQRRLGKMEGMGHLPPGALIAQNNNVLAQYVSGKGPGGLRPISSSWWSIHVIVNLSNRRAYVGRTMRSPFLRFHEHVMDVMDGTSHFGRSLRDSPNGFAILLLEKVPEGTALLEYRERESSWISGIDNLHLEYNSRRETAKPPDPLVLTHGYGPAPIKRS